MELSSQHHIAASTFPCSSSCSHSNSATVVVAVPYCCSPCMSSVSTVGGYEEESLRSSPETSVNHAKPPPIGPPTHVESLPPAKLSGSRLPWRRQQAPTTPPATLQGPELPLCPVTLLPPTRGTDAMQMKSSLSEITDEASPAVGLNSVLCSSTSQAQIHSEEEPDGVFASRIISGLLSGKYRRTLHADSCGGTYWIVDAVATTKGRAPPPHAVFKPAEEEIGQPRNPHGNVTSERCDEFAPGTGYLREVLAYRLDHQRSANVPQTVEVTIDGQVGSLQRFVANCSETWDKRPKDFTVEDVHRIAVMDLRMLNADRNGGNILVQQVGEEDDNNSRLRLVAIDHSYVIPSCFGDPEFEWMFWPQAKLPFSQSLLQYIRSLDAESDAALVREVLDDDDAAELLIVATRLMQFAASRGYTPLEIATYVRRETITQPSKLERLLGDCRKSLDDGGTVDFDVMERYLAQQFPSKF